jgi:alcohol dehydrogenase (cytochrome c)
MRYPKQREKRSMLGRGIALAACALAWGSWVAAAQQDTGPFTSGQASQGHKDYSSACAACHHENLSGGGEAPSLAGGNFLKSWGTRSTRELYDYIHSAMPLGKGGSLSDKTYENIVAFLLEANGATPGGKPFTADTEVTIGNVTNGLMPAGIAHAGEAAPPPRTGLTIAGQIPHYTPVTDAMLTHPADSDWLMFRRNYQGWSFSPLHQIDAGNVNNLQLKWAWAMNEGGANEVTPIIHDGILFLSNTDNIVQALDAKTGKLIWENRIGPKSPVLYGGNRSLALYQDKVLVATTDAHLVALDARTGKIAWNVSIAGKGHNQTGGVMVIHGKVLTGLTGCSAYAIEKCAITAFDANTGAQDWRFSTIALTGTPGAIPGTGWTISIAPAARPGSQAPTIPASISPTGAWPRPSPGCAPAAAPATAPRSIPAPRSRSTPTPASYAGILATRQASRSTWTRSSSASSSTMALRRPS